MTAQIDKGAPKGVHIASCVVNEQPVAVVPAIIDRKATPVRRLQTLAECGTFLFDGICAGIVEGALDGNQPRRNEPPKCAKS